MASPDKRERRVPRTGDGGRRGGAADVPNIGDSPPDLPRRRLRATYSTRGSKMTMREVGCIALAAALLAPGGAFAEPMNAGSLKLAGRTQSECLRAAGAGLKDAGFENAVRGKTAAGEPSSSFFANDKPYYAVVFCEGDVAFVAVSGPDMEKRREIYGKIARAIRGEAR